MATSNYMTTAYGLDAGASIGSAIMQGQALKARGAYQKQQYDLQARLQEMQGADAIDRGNKAAEQHLKATKGMIGSQRAAMGAQGVDVNDGTAAEIQRDTAALGALDAMTIKNNAWREAWGYRMQALQSRQAGEMSELAGNQQATMTYLTGGMQALGSLAKAGYYYQGGSGGSNDSGGSGGGGGAGRVGLDQTMSPGSY